MGFLKIWIALCACASLAASHPLLAKLRTKREISGLPPSGIDDDLKTALVDLHNEFRKQEGASNMKKMGWDEDLAQMAQAWADDCLWKHGHVDESLWKPPVTWDWVGQNLAAYSGQGENPLIGLRAWYAEKPDYDFDTRGCAPGRQCGHYTQVVWANTSHVGCGHKVCDELYMAEADGTRVKMRDDAYYLVCNYGAGGNNPTQDPFIEGAACTACQSDMANCEDGLCTASSDDDDDDDDDEEEEEDGTWEAWGAWGACSVSCGGGSQVRVRDCSTDDCDGEEEDQRTCATQPCNDGSGGWTNWSEWSACSATCGSGNKWRVRRCLDEDTGCDGNGAESMSCTTGACPPGSDNGNGGTGGGWGGGSGGTGGGSGGDRRGGSGGQRRGGSGSDRGNGDRGRFPGGAGGSPGGSGGVGGYPGGAGGNNPWGQRGPQRPPGGGFGSRGPRGGGRGGRGPRGGNGGRS